MLDAGLDNLNMIPTHVGVNRKRLRSVCALWHDPHARGGEPSVHIMELLGST